MSPIRPLFCACRPRDAAVARASACSGARQRGVSIVELMIGLLLGLLGTLVITQVLTSAEGIRRTTGSGSDARVNGAIGLFTLQRDLEMSGYGLAASSGALGCTIKSSKFASSGGDRVLAPVIITDGASGAADSIRVLAASSSKFSVPILVTTAHGTTNTVADAAFGVANTVGVVSGDLMLAVPQTPSATNTCTVFRANGTVTASSIPHAPGVGDVNAWNEATQAALMLKFPTAGYPINSYLVNLGDGLIDRTYSVSAASALQVVEFDNANATNLAAREVVPQIANLQAFYGKDTDGDGVIDTYDTVLPTSNLLWSRVMAIRVALVARSSQYEKEIVTTAAPVWNMGATPTVTGATACGASQCLTLRVNFDIASDWQHYRYRVYDLVIPMRNMTWRS